MNNNASYQIIHPDDSVLVTLRNFSRGEVLSVKGREILVRSDVPVGHKIALRKIQAEENIIKYGFPIGSAKGEIEKGDWVHTYNADTNLKGTLEYEYRPVVQKVRAAASDQTFQGFIRKNGDVGVRNEIWVINTVGCINKTAEVLANLAGQTYVSGNIDGFFHFPHPFGCSQLGDDLQNTQKVLANLVKHPNAAGVLVLGLGCENNFIESFKDVLDDYDEDRVKFLATQDVEDELEEGLKLIGELVDYAESFKRQPVSISKLRIGLKCGGSDGLSGITANPLVGMYSDMLVSFGGTTILTEVPEMFGAETILMNRAQNQEVFFKVVNLINGFKQYFIDHGQEVYENPSPGNKKGGITTLEEKSLGCVQKGGTASVVDVVSYADHVTKQGLNLVQGPGNDLVSVTNLAVSGAHIVLFTTGRGTPYGGPVPTVKISTNTALYEKKKNWIDFNAGQLTEGKSMEDLTKDFFDYIVRLASGETRTKNEQSGFKEIAMFKDGVTL